MQKLTHQKGLHGDSISVSDCALHIVSLDCLSLAY